MIRNFSNFMTCEYGAVTVDWVVLTAVVGLGLLAVGVGTATGALGGKISTSLSAMTVATY
ncbi:MAG: hypothetical protein GKR99_05810 [Rhodobacteraceae bacterium]|nr:hypothetical protein [Paracoccaceae bacterium]